MAEKLIPARAIQDKIEELSNRRASIYDQIEKLKAEYTDLADEQRLYEHVLDLAVEPEPGGPLPPQPSRRLPPSEAILRLVGEKPGITRTEAIEQLEGQVATTSPDVPHLLRNTIYNLTRRGNKLVLQDERLFLFEQGPESLNGSSGPKS